MRQLVVSVDDRRVGTLHEGDDLWSFEYDEAWAEAPDGHDLAPGLPRAVRRHADGATRRPVQWYFDNLLPEELLRQAVSKEAGIQGDDAFALLEYLGAESAGSLTLLPPGAARPASGGLVPLPDDELARRIAALPRQTLTAGAPKRMSLAGAQHKLLVVRDGERLYEPVGTMASTHILKPAHPDTARWPASVLNEYVTMRLAAAAGLPVPAVALHGVPEAVYLVERFDRRVRVLARPDSAPPVIDVQRLHIVDACQLLDRPRVFKHSGASLEALAALVERTTNRLHTRLQLFRWLVFNLLVGNDDGHLKNLSFFVAPDGVRLAPHYDLLATGVYATRAFAYDDARWPGLPMTITLPGAALFGEVRAEAVIEAGRVLGLPAPTARRVLGEVTARVPPALKALSAEIAQRHAGATGAARAHVAAEARLLRVLEVLIVREMLGRLTR